jgi:hypothetical protein
MYVCLGSGQLDFIHMWYSRVYHYRLLPSEYELFSFKDRNPSDMPQNMI